VHMLKATASKKLVAKIVRAILSLQYTKCHAILVHTGSGKILTATSRFFIDTAQRGMPARSSSP
jgi:hypothetical protein